mmetsp:Transcript_22064/g.50422  ORF Transcript_22064/g.50422 Transcript_22064/m.50422 type:complete len:339 (-) Transcript_22064:225-1241(-)
MFGLKLTVVLALVLASPTIAVPSGGKQGGTPEDAATEALKSAQSAYNTAKDSAVKQLDNLAAYHKHVESMAVDEEVARLEKKAQQLVEDDAQAAKKDLDKTLERVQSAGALPSFQDMDDVKKSAHVVFDMEKAKGKVLMNLLKQDAKEQVQAAQAVGRSAVKAVQDEHKAARALEDAQRKAGVPESVFEKQYAESERLSEHMEGLAEQSRDRISDAVESFYSKLEHKLEAKTDASNDKALQTMEDVVSGLLKEHQPQTKGGKTAAAKGKDAPATKGDSKPDTPVAKPKVLDDLPEQNKEAQTSMVTMAGLAVMVLGAAALAYVKRPSRVIKDAPPLLG